MTKKSVYIFLVVMFLFSNLDAQRLLKMSVNRDGEENLVSFVVRKGKTYISAIDLAKALGGRHYYNNDAAKVEMKFNMYNLKITARNQFLILSSKTDGSKDIYQIPISTMMLKNDVYIPIEFCINILEKAYGGELTYNNDKKHLVVGRPSGYDPIIAPPVVAKTDKSKPDTKIDSPYDIYDIDIDEKSNGTLIRIKSQKPIRQQPRSSIKEGTLYLYLSGVSVDNEKVSKSKTSGLVKGVKVKSVSGNPQLQFKLKEGYSTHETFNNIDNNDILITIHNKKFVQPEPVLTDEKSKWKFDVVVLDAGHGGKDPGAIGATGVREKDVNLGVTKKLGALIEKNMPNVKVVYTRKDDKFIELSQRGKIANENEGKLFISIHANSLGKKKSHIRGFDVYLLRPGRTQEAIEIAEIENSVIRYEDNPNRYEELTDENFILVSMAHSSYMRYSEKFSDLLYSEWKRDVKIPARGIKQAGFYVLVGASMPGVLIETGFITNKQDEAYLKSSAGQQKIASAIFRSIKAYKNYYEQSYAEED